jgi:hypothetical protein
MTSNWRSLKLRQYSQLTSGIDEIHNCRASRAMSYKYHIITLRQLDIIVPDVVHQSLLLFRRSVDDVLGPLVTSVFQPAYLKD